jgi:hypothetical protein
MVDGRDFSLQSARRAAEHDELHRWVARFLASPGSDNPVLGEQLTRRASSWLGPVRLPLSKLHRLAGPDGEPVLCAVDDDYWRDDVDEMSGKIEQGWEPPPVIVSFQNGRLVLEDGNHRVESLRRAGERSCWAVVAFDDEDQRKQFTASHPE